MKLKPKSQRWSALFLGLMMMLGGCEPLGQKGSKVLVEGGYHPSQDSDPIIKNSYWIPYIVIGGDIGKTCTGIALTPKKVLTAAHCLWSSNARKYADKRDIGLVFSIGSGKLPYRVEKFEVHPLYLPGVLNVVTGTFDLAVLNVEGTLDPRILGIKPFLATDSSQVKKLILKKRFIFMGYGIDGLFRMGADVPIPSKICLADPNKTLRVNCENGAVNMFCAAPDSSEPKITGGDSGGPALSVENGVPMVFGMTVGYTNEFSFFETFDRPETKNWILSQLR